MSTSPTSREPAPADASLQRSVNSDNTLRIVTVVSTAPVRDLCERSGLRGLEAIIAGRALTAGYLLATVAKDERERFRVQLRGEGTAGTIVADAHGDGRGRAALQARLDRPLEGLPAANQRASVATAVGADGQLTVTRDLGLRRPYQGTVDLVSGEIDEDLEAYLTLSEQLPSTLRCAIWFDDAGDLAGAAGVLVQTFPGSDPAMVDAARERMRALPLEAIEVQALSHAKLAVAATGADTYRVVHEHRLRFECGCGPQNARRVVSSLGADDLDALADEQEQTDVRCNFCGRVTVLDSAELRDVAQQIREARQASDAAADAPPDTGRGTT